MAKIRHIPPGAEKLTYLENTLRTAGIVEIAATTAPIPSVPASTGMRCAADILVEMRREEKNINGLHYLAYL